MMGLSGATKQRAFFFFPRRGRCMALEWQWVVFDASLLARESFENDEGVHNHRDRDYLCSCMEEVGISQYLTHMHIPQS